MLNLNISYQILCIAFIKNRINIFIYITFINVPLFNFSNLIVICAIILKPTSNRYLLCEIVILLYR